MGLDMYLNAKLYVGGIHEHRKVKGACNIEIGDKPEYNIPCNIISSIEIYVGYWRKANAIHKWFVDNVQEGVDECQETALLKEDLIILKGICQNILKNRTLAEKLLPVASGFFFGSTEYDEGYFEDLKETIIIIDKALLLNDDYDLYYRSSW